MTTEDGKCGDGNEYVGGGARLAAGHEPSVSRFRRLPLGGGRVSCRPEDHVVGSWKPAEPRHVALPSAARQPRDLADGPLLRLRDS